MTLENIKDRILIRWQGHTLKSAFLAFYNECKRKNNI